MRVDVVIVNWNSGTLARECVVALECSASSRDFNIIVVDNASNDGSAKVLYAAGGIDLVSNSDNRGFAAACNQGAARGNASYILD